MNNYKKFILIFSSGIWCSCLGPFLILGPIFGFPIILILSIIATYFIKDSDRYIKKVFLLFFLSTLVFVLLFFGGSGLDMLAIGMMFQGFGIASWCFVAPYITRSEK